MAHVLVWGANKNVMSPSGPVPIYSFDQKSMEGYLGCFPLQCYEGNGKWYPSSMASKAVYLCNTKTIKS